MGDFNFLEEFGKEGGALPQQEAVKIEILKSRNEALKKVVAYDGHSREAKNLRNALQVYYMNLKGHENEDIVSENSLRQFYKVGDIVEGNGYNIKKLDRNQWSEIFEIIDEVAKQIGIRKITRKKNKTWIGYEIFDGIRWPPTQKWKNWQRTLLNMKNLAKEIKKKDKDARGIVWGKRGLGKSTFSLWCMKEIYKTINNENLAETENLEKHFIESLSDMKKVRSEAITPYQMDEMLTLLNAKRAMSNENVETEEILAKWRYKNTFGLWCTTEPQNLSESHIKQFDFLVHVFDEGKFKFFNGKKMEDFNKKNGEWKYPSYNWIGHFPKMNNKLWNKYEKSIEPEKDKTRKEIRKEKEKKEKKDKGPTKKKQIIEKLNDGKSPKEISKENKDMDLQYARNIASQINVNNK